MNVCGHPCSLQIRSHVSKLGKRPIARGVAPVRYAGRTPYQEAPVNKKYRFVLAVIALVVLGTSALASGATGDPLILGAVNEAGKGTSLSSDTELGEPTLTVTASGTQIPFAAVAGDESEFAAYVRGYEDGLKLDGAMETDRAGVVVIPAGQTRITFVPRTGPESDSENPVQP